MKKVTALFSAAVLLFTLSIGCFAADADKDVSFRNKDFRILVLTDTQDDHYPAPDMLNLITKAIEESKPNLIVYEGDIVEDTRTADPGVDAQGYREGVAVKDLSGNLDHDKTLENIKVALDKVVSIFEASGVPFAPILGNNEYKCGLTNAEWLGLYSQYKNCLMKDMSDDAEDRIDYFVPIKNSEGKTVFNIWMLDSGKHGINDDQVDWYKKTSEELKRNNNGKAIPAFAFQHIQMNDIGNLFEECKMWNDGARAVGTKFYRLNKSIANGRYLFGYEPCEPTYEFKAFKEQGDVIGAFFGHQHVEGFSGKVDGIELGFTYGCEMAKTGPYGYRLITLHENDITGYDNELYTYEGKVSLNNAHFEKQIDEPYPVYGNIFLETAARIKNTAFSVVSLLIDFFASL